MFLDRSLKAIPEVILSVLFWVGALLALWQSIVFLAVMLATVSAPSAYYFQIFTSDLYFPGGVLIVAASLIARFHKCKDRFRGLWVYMGGVGIFVIVTDLVGWP